MKKPKTVLCMGTFDGMHEGHVSYLKQAKKHGDKLVVVIARDTTVKKVKGKTPKFTEGERALGVQSIPFVDLATLGYAGDKYKIIEEIKPDVICLGYDQTSFTEGLAEALKKRGLKAKILRMKPYKPSVYKSSLLNR